MKLADSISEAKVNADAPEMKDEGEDDEDETAMTTRDRLNKLRMADLVQQHLKAQSLEVLVEGGLEDAVMRFVEKDDRDAIKELVHHRFEFSTDRPTASWRAHSRASANRCEGRISMRKMSNSACVDSKIENQSGLTKFEDCRC